MIYRYLILKHIKKYIRLKEFKWKPMICKSSRVIPFVSCNKSKSKIGFLELGSLFSFFLYCSYPNITFFPFFSEAVYGGGKGGTSSPPGKYHKSLSCYSFLCFLNYFENKEKSSRTVVLSIS